MGGGRASVTQRRPTRPATPPPPLPSPPPPDAAGSSWRGSGSLLGGKVKQAEAPAEGVELGGIRRPQLWGKSVPPAGPLGEGR